MIRRISVALLLTLSTLAHAQPLYKWIEADGTITFSPNKPPAGVVFETVNGGSESALSGIKPVAPQQAGNDEPGSSRLQYAPSTSKDAKDQPLPGAISRSVAVTAGSVSEPNTGNVELRGAETAISVSNGTAADLNEGRPIPSAQTSAARNKQNRCQDLRKRVVSLERRLKSRLTPEDMDNTVIHMARYQQSFDQYCAQ